MRKAKKIVFIVPLDFTKTRLVSKAVVPVVRVDIVLKTIAQFVMSVALVGLVN